jgi:hypothetical protein
LEIDKFDTMFLKFLNGWIPNILMAGFFVLASPVFVSGQKAGETVLSESFAFHSERTVREKMFVHLDRSTYIAGETMWFKIYLTDGKTHHLSDLSKVAYLEVLDADNTPVIQRKIEMKRGVGTGSYNHGYRILCCESLYQLDEEFFRSVFL